MLTIRLPGKPHPRTADVAHALPQEAADLEQSGPEQSGPLDGELLDLYAAIAIVVPLALFLKSFWP